MEKKICPLMLTAGCQGKNCQWWVDKADRCVIALIPEALNRLVQSIDQK